MTVAAPSPPLPLPPGAVRACVRVLCRPALAPGFAAAGLSPVVASTPGEGAARLLGLLDRPEVGILLVEEPCYDALPEEARRRLGRLPRPMVVPFPAPAWRAGAAPEGVLLEILRQAIGYRVRLR